MHNHACTHTHTHWHLYTCVHVHYERVLPFECRFQDTSTLAVPILDSRSLVESLSSQALYVSLHSSLSTLTGGWREREERERERAQILQT